MPWKVGYHLRAGPEAHSLASGPSKEEKGRKGSPSTVKKSECSHQGPVRMPGPNRPLQDRQARKKTTDDGGHTARGHRVNTNGRLKESLWEAANILRGSAVDRTDWKGYILPLLFFKRISDVWDEERAESVRTYGDTDPSQFPEAHRFHLPDGCHWRDILQLSKSIVAFKAEFAVQSNLLIVLSKGGLLK